MSALLSTAYWPNLHYFYYVLNANQILIEQHEHYQKQSYRNRTSILSANGVLDLSIPVINTHQKQVCSEIEIAYKENWQIKHWRAITSAYRNAPYFEYFEHEIFLFYDKQYPNLMNYNQAQIDCVLNILRVKKTIERTSEFIQTTGEQDLREIIHPKNDFMLDKNVGGLLAIPYYQTFSEKFPFVPNLSILDLLFNTGLGVVEHLKTPE